jgi:hypothetical protein
MNRGQIVVEQYPPKRWQRLGRLPSPLSPLPFRMMTLWDCDGKGQMGLVVVVWSGWTNEPMVILQETRFCG